MDAGRIRASQILISPVKLLPRTWAWTPKMSFRKSRDSPITRPMLGFKNFHSAQKTLAGIEIMKMIKKGQMFGGDSLSPAGQFYSFAA
ncbi:hypothetical protein BMR02_10405 [Methylococcaceae bacterium HT1]|nr:hypothetical protein BMR02_10405 [Methylococcaceae bacterium HT1]